MARPLYATSSPCTLWIGMTTRPLIEPRPENNPMPKRCAVSFVMPRSAIYACVGSMPLSSNASGLFFSLLSPTGSLPRFLSVCASCSECVSAVPAFLEETPPPRSGLVTGSSLTPNHPFNFSAASLTEHRSIAATRSSTLPRALHLKQLKAFLSRSYGSRTILLSAFRFTGTPMMNWTTTPELFPTFPQPVDVVVVQYHLHLTACLTFRTPPSCFPFLPLWIF